MIKNKKKFIIVDGTYYLFKSYYAMPNFVTKTNEYTGATYGFINIIKNMINKYRPTYFVVVFDSTKKTFRHKMYSAYKSNRSEMPINLQLQIQNILKIIKATGIISIIHDGVEADDVIGTLAINANKDNDVLTIIASKDKDMAQLINENIVLLDSSNSKLIKKKDIIGKFGILPSQVVDYLAISGDKSDNIPGVKSVGPKTAAKWLNKYKNIENISKNANEITGVIGKNLKQSIKNKELDLYQQLTKIKTTIELPYKINELIIKQSNKIELQKIFEQLEFRGLLKELNISDGFFNIYKQKITAPTKKNIEIIKNKLSFIRLINKIKKCKAFSFYVKHINSKYIKSKINFIFFSFSLINIGEMESFYTIINIKKNRTNCIISSSIIKEINTIFNDKNILKVSHDIKASIKTLKLLNINLNVDKNFFDIMIASYIAIDLPTGNHNIEDLSKHILNLEIDINKIDKSKEKNLMHYFNNIILKKTEIIAKTYSIINKKLEKNKQLKQVFEKVEMKIIPILFSMEEEGVLIDTKLLHLKKNSIIYKIKELEKKIYNNIGGKFNINSSKEIYSALSGKLALCKINKTPTGRQSMSSNSLNKLLKNKIIADILEYKRLNSLYTLFIKGLIKYVDKSTCKIHTTYNQTITNTGRLSSSTPNLQNIPIKNSKSRKIRDIFIVDKGYKVLSADYSQIEFKILAHISNENKLINAFNENIDIHALTASEIFQVNINKVTGDQRTRAKIINFALIYGMSSITLSKKLEITTVESKRYIEGYFKKFNKIKRFIDGIKENVLKTRMTSTIFGRHIYFNKINSKVLFNSNYSAMQRAAVNSIMQGSQADIIKIAMISIGKWIYKNKYKIKLIMQIHDELIFLVPEEQLKESIKNISSLMENATSLKVKLSVKIKYGNNLGDLKEYNG